MMMRCKNSQCNYVADEEFEVPLIFCPLCRGELEETLAGEGDDVFADLFADQPDEAEYFPDSRDVIAAEIGLAYKHFYLTTGEHGCIPLRLVNNGRANVKYIDLTVKCSAFVESEHAIGRGVRLAPDVSTEIGACDSDLLAIAGFFTVGIEGYYQTADDTPVAFRGRFTLRIRKPEEKASIIAESGSVLAADSIDFEAVKEVITRDGAVVDFSNTTQNAAGNRGDWIPITVEFDPERTLILKDLGSRGESAPRTRQDRQIESTDSRSRAFLRFASAREKQTVQILTGKSWILGRSPERSHVLTTLLPWTPENGKQSNCISGTHCELEVTGDTPQRVTLLDRSTNGTWLSGTKLSGKEPAELASDKSFSLAGVLGFKYRELRELRELEEIDNLLRGSRSLRELANSLASLKLNELFAQAPLNGFVLKRDDEFREKIQYVFLRRAVTLGSSPECGIVLPDDTVSGQHARLSFMHGGYCLEDFGSRQGTRVDGERLSPYQWKPLGDKATIEFGEARVEFNAEMLNK